MIHSPQPTKCAFPIQTVGAIEFTGCGNAESLAEFLQQLLVPTSIEPSLPGGNRWDVLRTSHGAPRQKIRFVQTLSVTADLDQLEYELHRTFGVLPR